MSDRFIEIYARRAAEYHRVITAEDVDGNLRQAFESLIPMQGKRVLDLGTGTGRLPLLLAAATAQFTGLDLHWDMLQQNELQRKRVRGGWALINGDMRQLPIRPGAFDLVSAAWAIGHLRSWYADNWQRQIGQVLNEMRRVAAPGAMLVIVETLTTGSLTPAPPTAGLAEYYAWLENTWGFTRHTLRTDYQFESVEQAVAWTEFFFGPELSEKIRAHGWARLPEWTGMWVLRL